MLLSLPAPQDLELHIARPSVSYHLVLPTAGVREDTGLIVYIYGYNFSFNDGYAQKLLPFLADTYNCAAISVDYFGARCYQGGMPNFPADFFSRINALLGRDAFPGNASFSVQSITAAFREIRQHGIASLPDDLTLQLPSDEYNSFGLLPALDHLHVIHHLFSTASLDRKRIFVLGTSYGGYIGLMLNKLAPNTFRMIVDNSGFTSPDDTPASVFGFLRSNILGVDVNVRTAHHFSSLPTAPNFFTPSFSMVRELRTAHHYRPSETVVYSYHSASDTIASADRKQELFTMLAAVRPGALRIVTEADIDGTTFKTTAHGMRASLRALFDHSYRAFSARRDAPPDHTDFELGTDIAFECPDDAYLIRFNPQSGIAFDRASAGGKRSA